MARFRVERITVEELFVDTENIDDACQWGLALEVLDASRMQPGA